MLKVIAQGEVYKTAEMPANRGDILTTDGRLLASSVPYYTIYMDTRSSGMSSATWSNGINGLSAGLAQLLGDGQREIEFKMLGEWFSANAKPDDKMAVYQNDTQLFAGKFAQNVVGFPKAANPGELVEKLRREGVTYVVWATREGFSHGQHTGYQLLGLNKNIAFLDKPRNIGCYEFIRQVGTEHGYVNIFRLKGTGDEQLPN